MILVRPAGVLALTLLVSCSEGNEPTTPVPRPQPPAPAAPVYGVRPPDGKLPWPHHDPAWDQATFNRKSDSLWVVNNFGAYTGTSDRSILYLHNAWDLVLPNGTPVFAVAPGTVRAEIGGNQFYRSLIIEDGAMPGFGWAYTHIYNFVVVPGQQVFQGTRLGSVNFQGLEHIHLSRVKLKPGGRWDRFYDWESIQPDKFFAYRDTEAPTFDGPFRYVRNLTDDAFAAPAGNPFIVVSGDVDIVVGLRDGGEWTRSKAPFGGIAPGFGNAHAVSRIEYDIANSAGIIDRKIAFDLSRNTIPEGPPSDEAALLLTMYQHYESATPRPTPGSNNRFAFYALTNSPGTEPEDLKPLVPNDAARAWKTAELNSDGSPRYPNGEYTITVRAFDSKGNMSSRVDRVIVNN